MFDVSVAGRPLTLGVLSFAGLAMGSEIGPQDLSPSNVVWETPSDDARGSMPLGNGETGVNLWVEKATGDVLLYLARGDAWTENTPLYRGDYGLAKVGRLRIHLGNQAFLNPPSFRQEYDLATAAITVKAQGTTLRAWVDANSPLVHLEFQAGEPFTVQTRFESYRQQELRGTLQFQKVLWTDDLAPATGDDALILSRDHLLEPRDGRIGWCYRNQNPYRIPALQDWTFGALVGGEGMAASGPDTLTSQAPATRQVVQVATYAFAAPSVAAWQQEAERRLATIPTPQPEAAWDRHVAWWHAFWNRSFILVDGDPQAQALTQGYLLGRQLQAFQGRGTYPIKFNGGLFNVEHQWKARNLKTGEFEVREVSADWREWGGHYWFQNTRPMYWPMLAAGDHDLMQPFFQMYRAILTRNEQDCRRHYGHEGAYLAEAAPFIGGLPKVTADQPGTHTRHYYTPILELGVMLVDYVEYTQDETFAREYLVPMLRAGLTFFRDHFPRDPQGRLRIEPANSAEMFWKTRNPVTDVAGLHYLIPRLLALPEAWIGAELQAEWRQLLAILPPIPQRVEGTFTRLLPYEAAEDQEAHNQENPELYAIYPFRLYTIGQGPERERIGRDNFAIRRYQRAGCWYQDPIQAALVGDADTAADGALHALTNRDPRVRFPAFWDAGNDYVPDFDNGGHGMHALQLMLLQSVGSSLHIAPAWPRRWSARFRLHAPGRTVVEGLVRAEGPSTVTVAPALRQGDVVDHRRP